MSKQGILWLVALSVIALATAGLYLHTSIWYIWNKLPDADLKIAVDLQQLDPALVNQFYPNLSAEALAKAGRLGLAQTADSTLIVATPSQPFLFSSHSRLTEHLVNSGWQVRRHGLLILATQGGAITANATYRFPLSDYFKTRNPLLLLQAKQNATPYFDQPISVVATRHQDEMLIIANFQDTDLPTGISDTAYSLPQKINQLSLAMASDNLRFIPTELANSWTTILHDRLGFTLTSPEILAELAQHQAISINIDDHNVTLGIQGDPDQFSDAARIWLQTEDARNNLVSRAFRLPDGTLGYEKIPGELRPVFYGIPVKGCLPAGLVGRQDQSLWLCQNEDRAALGTDEETTRDLVLRSPHEGEEVWYVAANTEALSSQSLALFSALTATGNEKQAIIRLKLK